MYKWQKDMIEMTRLGNAKGAWSKEAIERLQDDLGPYKLKLDTHDYKGVTYYVAQPVGWLHIEEARWNHMMAWVIETFGPTSKDGIWTAGERWYANNARFYFRDIKDRDWFVLRWSA